MWMEEFDWVFNGDDMAIAFLVDQIDHGGEGGGFSAAGRTGYTNQPAGQHGKLLDGRGQTQVLAVGDIFADCTEHTRDATSLHEHIHPKSGKSRDAE